MEREVLIERRGIPECTDLIHRIYAKILKFILKILYFVVWKKESFCARNTQFPPGFQFGMVS